MTRASVKDAPVLITARIERRNHLTALELMAILMRKVVTLLLLGMRLRICMVRVDAVELLQEMTSLPGTLCTVYDNITLTDPICLPAGELCVPTRR